MRAVMTGVVMVASISFAALCHWGMDPQPVAEASEVVAVGVLPAPAVEPDTVVANTIRVVRVLGRVCATNGDASWSIDLKESAIQIERHGAVIVVNITQPWMQFTAHKNLETVPDKRKAVSKIIEHALEEMLQDRLPEVRRVVVFVGD